MLRPLQTQPLSRYQAFPFPMSLTFGGGSLCHHFFVSHRSMGASCHRDEVSMAPSYVLLTLP